MKKNNAQQNSSQPVAPSSYRAQFGVTPIQAHAHTGADSLPVNYNDLINKPSFSAPLYSGYVNSDGTAGSFFPSGWTSAKAGTGDYKVTHNRGNTNYAATPIAASANCVPQITYTDTYFEAQFTDATTGSNVNTDFSFIFTTQSNP